MFLLCSGDTPSVSSATAGRASHGSHFLADCEGDAVLAAAHYNFRRLLAWLTLQLHFRLKMRFSGCGLMRPSPEGPGDNARWLDAP
jgi:hypothetical protein